MIGPRQLALLECARVRLRLSAAEFAELLREEGHAGDAADLSGTCFNDVMDRLTTYGFRDRRRPVLSAGTLHLLAGWLAELGMATFEVVTLLRHHAEVGDMRDLDGDGLLRLLVALERRGAPLADFIASRRTVTRKQLALLHVASTAVDLSESDKSWALQHLAGVNTSADLDQRGFDLMMAVMRNRGFRSRAPAPKRASFGQRPGFASPQQVALIRELWAEWSGAHDEAALNTWLERFHATSTLRFLTTAKAGNAITALKSMKAAKARAGKADKAEARQ